VIRPGAGEARKQQKTRKIRELSGNPGRTEGRIYLNYEKDQTEANPEKKKAGVGGE